MFEKIDSLMNRVDTEKPASLEAIFALAGYWAVRGNPERAMSLYEEGLTRDDLNDEWDFVFRNYLVHLYSEVLGQHQKALEVVEQALATNRDNVTLLNTKGLILINAGDPSAAIPVLQRAVELTNQQPFYRMNLAYALHLDGQTTQSRRYFDAARDQLIPFIPDMNKMDKAMYAALLLAHP